MALASEDEIPEAHNIAFDMFRLLSGQLAAF